MKYPQIYYKESVYRPPAEANSLLIQATEGCTYNCTFCIGNYGKKFLIRPLEAIKEDIYNAKFIYGESVRKIFLLDGNAFVMKPDSLIEIAEYCNQFHPNLKRIGAYAHARDILAKSDEELKAIAASGIRIVYLGIETGDNELLQQINKRVTAEEITQAAHKLYNAGITLSATIILGLAGNNSELSRKHAIETAKLINTIKPQNGMPWYISALTLMQPQGTDLYNEMQSGQFKPMNNLECIRELKIILENLDDNLDRCIFRSNHASNYLPLESNNLARNKDILIKNIDLALTNPSILRNELYRSL